MPSFAYGAPEKLVPHIPADSTQLWDDVPELHVWGETQDFTLRTIVHPLGRVATIGACFTDRETYASTVADALENNTPESLTAFPGNYTTIVITPEGTKVLKDVAGVTPVYYSSSDEQVSVSSQPSVITGGRLKLLSAHIAAHIALPAWDGGGLSGNDTYFEGVSKLSGGQALEITTKDTVVSTYEPLNPEPSLTLEQGAERLRDAMRESVAARMRCGIEVRSNLSGGMDSGSIVALALEQLGPDDALQVYFMDDSDLPGGDRDHVETYVGAESRLKLTRIDSHETTISPDLEAVNQPEDLAFAISPHRFQVISDIYAPSKEAGRALHFSGNGGDEVVSVGVSHLPDLLTSGRIIRLAREGIARAKIRNVSPMDIWSDVVSLAFRGQGRSARQSAKKLDGDIKSEPFTSPFFSLDPTKINDMAANFLTPKARQGAAQLLRTYAEQVDTKPTLGQSLARDRVYASAMGQASEAYCVNQDSSISVEAPFLDNNVVRAALAVDVQHKGDPYRFKLILQEALRDIVPEHILHRNTKGVYDPHNARLHIETLLGLDELMEDSRLAEMNIISPDKIRDLLPSLGSLPLSTIWALERVLLTELWLRSLERSGLITIESTRDTTKDKAQETDTISSQISETTLSIPDHVHAVASSKGNLTLYSRKTNSYYPLDTVQSHILRAFATTGDVNAVVNTLAERYRNVDRSILETDTHKMLHNFVALGIIEQSDEFAARELPLTAVRARFTSGEWKMAQSPDNERPRSYKRALANIALLSAVTLSKVAPGRRLDVLKGLQEIMGGRPATYAEAQDTLMSVQRIKYLGRLACIETSYAAALGLAVQHRQVDWHMGVSFYPVSYHSWIEAEGSPIRTPFEGEVSGDFQSFFTT